MRYPKPRAGFSLPECLVATVILGIGVVGVAGMFACATLSERKAAHMAQAHEVAEKTLEEVRAGGYGVFSQPSGLVTIPTPDLPRSSGELAWQPYPDSASDQGLKLVSLNLSWNWAGSTSGKYRVTTLAAEQATW